MRSNESYAHRSRVLTEQLRSATRRPWPSNRQALEQRGIDVSEARVVDRIDDGDYLDYMLVVSKEGRVYLYFVEYTPGTEPRVLDWMDITDEYESNPHSRAIDVVLSSMK